MNKILVGLLVLSIVSCDNKETQTNEEESGSEPEHRELRKLDVSQMDIDTAHPPVLYFSDPLYDFGRISEGDKVNHTYKFTNTGESPLIIANAISPCGCTVPSYPEEPILPGQQGAIDVVFSSKGKAGTIHKQIKIIANTYPEKTQIVVLKGIVE